MGVFLGNKTGFVRPHHIYSIIHTITASMLTVAMIEAYSYFDQHTIKQFGTAYSLHPPSSSSQRQQQQTKCNCCGNKLHALNKSSTKESSYMPQM